MENYLQKELYEKMQTDTEFFDFLQEGSLDGVWYWDLENMENEWMSPTFWRVFGYMSEEKEHFASEWQSMIFPEDLQTAKKNLQFHLDNPSHPYDQIVRYRHKLGHTVWVRCRGMAIREEKTGKPIRLLGAHTDITKMMQAEAKVTAMQYQLDALKMQIETLKMKLEMRENKIATLENKMSSHSEQ